MRNVKLTKTATALTELKKEDTYSLILFALYQLKDLPDCLTLSQLAYILDGDNLVKFLAHFGGSTITIPTLRDLQLMVTVLMLYQNVNLEGHPFDLELRNLTKAEFQRDEVRDLYKKVVEVMNKYEFDTDLDT